MQLILPVPTVPTSTDRGLEGLASEWSRGTKPPRRESYKSDRNQVQTTRETYMGARNQVQAARETYWPTRRGHTIVWQGPLNAQADIWTTSIRIQHLMTTVTAKSYLTSRTDNPESVTPLVK